MTADEVAQFMRVLRQFNNIDPVMQVSTVLVLLESAVADLKKAPLEVGQIQMRVGLKSGTTSRNVYYWGEGHQHNNGGYNYITLKTSPVDRRVKTVHLTPEGRAFIHSL